MPHHALLTKPEQVPSTLTRLAGRLDVEISGRLADGKKYTGKGTVEILAPDKFAYKGTFYMDDEKLLDLNDVYERASH